MELNNAGVSVVYERLIEADLTPTSQLVGEAKKALIFSPDVAPTPAGIRDSLNTMYLHSQYTDLPLVHAAAQERKYEFGIFDWDRPALVESTQVADFLDDAAKSSPTTIYRV